MTLCLAMLSAIFAEGNLPGQAQIYLLDAYDPFKLSNALVSQEVSVAPPAEPRGEFFFFLQSLGGEKLLKFGEKWAVKNF